MKKIISLLLSIIVVLNLFTAVAFAEDSVNVNVTIYDKDGNIAVAQESISVTDADDDGKITICDALNITHREKYYGPDGFVISQGGYGLQIDILWGNYNGGSYGYYLNDASAYSLLDEVKDGDYLNAYSYTDLTNWTDTYTFFDKRTVSVKENEEITLVLNKSDYISGNLPLADAQITVNGEKIDVKTDTDGKVTFKIATEGEYLISAVSESVIVAPVCKVTVSKDSEGGEGTVNPPSGEGGEGTVNPPSGGGGGTIAPITADAEKILDKIIEYNLESEGVRNVQAWIDDTLTYYAGVSSEWYIFGLSQYGKRYDFDEYERALLSYLKRNTVSSASSRLKYALVLAAIGSTDGYIEEALEYATGEQGVISYAYGLHLLNNGYESVDFTEAKVIRKLVSLQLSDGGWAVSGEISDVDVTAMVVQALAPHYRSDEKAYDAVKKALDFISEKQKSNGEFASYGIENPETTAQVIIALSSLGIDCATDQRFIKDNKTLLKVVSGYQLSDGSICHTKGADTNDFATNQVFYAMVSYLRMLDGKEPIHILENCVLPDYDYGGSSSGGGSGSSGGKGNSGTSSKPDDEKTEITEKEPINQGWEKLSDGSWIYLNDNKRVSGWQYIDNVWYYFDKSIMKTGWEKIGNTWYYLKPSGAMATGWQNVNNVWYYLKFSGAMATGWIKDKNDWYYLKSSGAMATGWIEVNGKWYYLYESGKMAQNTMIGKYKVNSNGEWIK